MAFTLKIKAKALLDPKKTDIGALLKSCGMAHGSTNEFYILEERESNQGTAVPYNPVKLGRGIFFDFSENEKGSLTLKYNIPTTASEIDDFINLVQEIQKQLKKVELEAMAASIQ